MECCALVQIRLITVCCYANAVVMQTLKSLPMSVHPPLSRVRWVALTVVAQMLSVQLQSKQKSSQSKITKNSNVSVWKMFSCILCFKVSAMCVYDIRYGAAWMTQVCYVRLLAHFLNFCNLSTCDFGVFLLFCALEQQCEVPAFSFMVTTFFFYISISSVILLLFIVLSLLVSQQ